MWQQLFSHSWNHILSKAQIFWLCYCTLGGIAENNKLDLFLNSLVPGPALWLHPS